QNITPSNIPPYTPGYAPPEQTKKYFKVENIGPWTDYYSLGATLYFFIEGKSLKHSVERIDTIEESIVLSRKGQFNSKLLSLTESLLSLNIEDRQRFNYQSINALLNDIKIVDNNLELCF